MSVAVLCNAGNSMPRLALHAVAELYLADALKPDEPPKPAVLSVAEVEDSRACIGTKCGVTRSGSCATAEALGLGDGTALIAIHSGG